jgi:hypothetical protein
VADDEDVSVIADCALLDVVDTNSVLLLVVDADVVDNVEVSTDDAIDVCSLWLLLVVGSLPPVDADVDMSSPLVVDELLALDEVVVKSNDDCVAPVALVVESVLVNGEAVVVKLLP